MFFVFKVKLRFPTIELYFLYFTRYTVYYDDIFQLDSKIDKIPLHSQFKLIHHLKKTHFSLRFSNVTKDGHQNQNTLELFAADIV